MKSLYFRKFSFFKFFHSKKFHVHLGMKTYHLLKLGHLRHLKHRKYKKMLNFTNTKTTWIGIRIVLCDCKKEKMIQQKLRGTLLL